MLLEFTTAAQSAATATICHHHTVLILHSAILQSPPPRSMFCYTLWTSKRLTCYITWPDGSPAGNPTIGKGRGQGSSYSCLESVLGFSQWILFLNTAQARGPLLEAPSLTGLYCVLLSSGLGMGTPPHCCSCLLSSPVPHVPNKDFH